MMITFFFLAYDISWITVLELYICSIEIVNIALLCFVRYSGAVRWRTAENALSPRVWIFRDRSSKSHSTVH